MVAEYHVLSVSKGGKIGGEDSIVLGPSLMYGGRRLAPLGKLYSRFVRSSPAKGYVNGMDVLRGLSLTPISKDWVEKSVFIPPMNIPPVARVAPGAALGLVDKDIWAGRGNKTFQD